LQILPIERGDEDPAPGIGSVEPTRHRGNQAQPRQNQGHEPWGDLNGALNYVGYGAA